MSAIFRCFANSMKGNHSASKGEIILNDNRRCSDGILWEVVFKLQGSFTALLDWTQEYKYWDFSVLLFYLLFGMCITDSKQEKNINVFIKKFVDTFGVDLIVQIED